MKQLTEQLLAKLKVSSDYELICTIQDLGALLVKYHAEIELRILIRDEACETISEN